MELYYESSNGTRINFMEHPIFAQTPETLISTRWSYTTKTDYTMDGIKEFFKNLDDVSLTLSIMANDVKSFNAVMQNLHRCFNSDIYKMHPGKIFWNGFYRECFIQDVSHSGFEEMFQSVEKKMHVLFVQPSWVKEIKYSLHNESSGVATVYPYRYPYTYSPAAKRKTLDAETYLESDFQAVIYGPAERANFSINDHMYIVDHAIGRGEYLVIDTRKNLEPTQRCYLVKADGKAENVFNDRNSQFSIFKKINPGKFTLNYELVPGIDLTVFSEQEEPEWI